jgi:hypothetical protein
LYLLEKPYKLRTEYLLSDYWSDLFTWTYPSIWIPKGRAEVTVSSVNGPVADAPVTVLTPNGYNMGMTGVFDENGVVNFRLLEKAFRFWA